MEELEKPFHIVKLEFKDGQKLPKHETETWCGSKLEAFEWSYVDLQHAALDNLSGSCRPICPGCAKAGAEALNQTENLGD